MSGRFGFVSCQQQLIILIMASLPLPFAQKRRRSPLLDLSPSVQLRTEEEISLSRPIKCAKRKKVSFKQGEPKVHLFDPDNGHGSVANKIIGNCIVIDDDDDDDDDLSQQQQPQLPLTAELCRLSTYILLVPKLQILTDRDMKGRQKRSDEQS